MEFKNSLLPANGDGTYYYYHTFGIKKRIGGTCIILTISERRTAVLDMTVAADFILSALRRKTQQINKL